MAKKMWSPPEIWADCTRMVKNDDGRVTGLNCRIANLKTKPCVYRGVKARCADKVEVQASLPSSLYPRYRRARR